MEGVNEKRVNVTRASVEGLDQSRKNSAVSGKAAGKKKRQARVMTANDLASINRRLDQCLPLETLEWQRVEQLLMQLSEFAPNSLVYETGMAVALYADDQARRAYLLGVEDGEERAETTAPQPAAAVSCA